MIFSKSAKLSADVKARIKNNGSKQDIFDELWERHSEYNYADDEKIKFARVIANYPTLVQREKYKLFHFSLIGIIALTGLLISSLILLNDLVSPVLTLIPLLFTTLFVYHLARWNGQAYLSVIVLTMLGVYRGAKDYPQAPEEQLYFWIGMGINLITVGLCAFLYLKLCNDYSEKSIRTTDENGNSRSSSVIVFKEENTKVNDDILV